MNCEWKSRNDTLKIRKRLQVWSRGGEPIISEPPRVQSEVALQDSVQVLLLCGQVRHYFVDLRNNGSEERRGAEKQEYAKHLRTLVNYADSYLGNFVKGGARETYPLPTRTGGDITCRRTSIINHSARTPLAGKYFPISLSFGSIILFQSIGSFGIFSYIIILWKI